MEEGLPAISRNGETSPGYKIMEGTWSMRPTLGQKTHDDSPITTRFINHMV